MKELDAKVIEQLLIGYKKPEDIIGENGLLKRLTKAVLERALQAELTSHLGYEKHDPARVACASVLCGCGAPIRYMGQVHGDVGIDEDQPWNPRSISFSICSISVVGNEYCIARRSTFSVTTSSWRTCRGS